MDINTDNQKNTEYMFIPSSTAFVALRIFDDTDASYKKILKDEWYLFNNWYRKDGNCLVKNENERDSHRLLYGKNITIQALVGKNGSGKSSILDIIYRLFNNLSYIITRGTDRPKAEELGYIPGIHARLFFETEGILGSLECDDDKMYLKWGDIEETMGSHYKSNDYTIKADNKLRKNVSRCFGYALVSNYAMMSLAPIDYDDESINPDNWLNSIYAKNDGYQACIGIEPYKGYNKIDLETQSSLCVSRLEGLIIATRNEGLFDGYSYDRIDLSVDRKYTSRKVNGKNSNDDDWVINYEDDFIQYYNNEKSVVRYVLDGYNYKNLNFNDRVILEAAVYVVWKTLSVVETYPQFELFRTIGNPKNFFENAEEVFTENASLWANLETFPYGNAMGLVPDMCKTMREDTSHATLKLRQAIFFLDYVEQKCKIKKSWKWNDEINTYENYMNEVNHGDIPSSIDEINNKFPPPFFQPNIYLYRLKDHNKDEIKKVVHFNSLSTGERQFMQTLSSIIYHIRNVASIVPKEGMLKYHNIFIFLDEIEVSFHPEYQEKFIDEFIGMIEKQKLLDKCNINVTIATHSPFILTDIPRNNIICLEDGVSRSDAIKGETFASNVYDLLSNQFFMNSFVGDFSKKRIQFAISKLKEWNKNSEILNQSELAEVCNIISLIGDRYLKTKLEDMLIPLLKPTENTVMKEFFQKKQELETLKKKLIYDSDKVQY